MSEVTSYQPGTPNWVDLMTPDVERAKAFYADLFGWEYEDQEQDGEYVYTMCRKGGRDAAGIGRLTEEMRANGVPSVWTTYIAVISAAESAARVAELGGTVLQPAFDVMDAGRMAVCADPGGAVFSVWEAKNSIGAGVVNEPGCFCWNECNTKDREKIGAFYQELFGYHLEPQADNPYTELWLDGRPVGGMMTMQPEWGDVPAHWMTYFAVEDTDAAAATIKAGGGSILAEPFDIAPGRMSVAMDPLGATFSVITLNPDVGTS